MTTYLLLLRGINVGGNHRVPMADLRAQLTVAGFTNVSSYINSGNLFFDSDQSPAAIDATVAQVLQANYDFPLDFRVLSQAEFLADLALAPAWWGQDPALRHNALFKLNSYQPEHDQWLLDRVTTDYDRVLITPNVIFWTSTLKINFSRSFYSKLIGQPLYRQTSARNFNTTKKLQALLTK